MIDERTKILSNIFDEIIDSGTNVKKSFTISDINDLSDNNELDDVIKSFDVQKELNPQFWINGKLNSRVRLKLLDIADDFFESLNVDWVKPKDIIMTGSLANYNWSKYSDIDLHIVLDFNDVDDRTEFVKDYFDSKKNLWNEQHENLTIYGYPVELYVQDSNETHTSSGVYSIEKNDWVVEPERDELASVKLDKEKIIAKTIKYADLIEKLEKLCKKEKDIEKVDVLSGKVKALFDKLKAMRKDSLKNGNELSFGNIIWKCLRRLGLIERLIDLKALTYDKIKSIK